MLSLVVYYDRYLASMSMSTSIFSELYELDVAGREGSDGIGSIVGLVPRETL